MRSFLLLLVCSSLYSMADNRTGNIIQVSRKIRMSRLESAPQKEFYVDLGLRDGMKAGDILEVYRMLPVINSMSGGPWHLLKVTLGEIRLTYVGDSTSIGRVTSEREPQSLPSIDYQSFMVGDQVELRTQLPKP